MTSCHVLLVFLSLPKLSKQTWLIPPGSWCSLGIGPQFGQPFAVPFCCHLGPAILTFPLPSQSPPQPFPPKNDRISQRPMLCSPRRRRLLYCLNRNWKWCQDQEMVIWGISKCDALRPSPSQIHHFIGGYFGGPEFSDTFIDEMKNTQNPINNASCQAISTLTIRSDLSTYLEVQH